MLSELAQLKTLETLGLQACNKLTDKGLPSLNKMKLLKFLNLTECESISEGGVKYLQRLLPGCNVSGGSWPHHRKR